MKLVVAMTTYNRLYLSKRTLKSLLDTVTGEYLLVIVDNASTDGTREWIQSRNHPASIKILNETNRYPGASTNQGWAAGIKAFPEADYLMQLDNDYDFLPGWVDKAEDHFIKIEKLGQLGFNYQMVEQAPEDEIMEVYYEGKDGPATRMQTRPIINGKQILTWPGNVGGTSIIRRAVYDEGIKYNEETWSHDGSDMSTPVEDAKLAPELLKAGWYFGHSLDELGRHSVTSEDWANDPEYYKESLGSRGYMKFFDAAMEKARREGRIK